MNHLAKDERYGLLFHGKVYATGAESIHQKISNKAVIVEEEAREQERGGGITDWLWEYSVVCD